MKSTEKCRRLEENRGGDVKTGEHGTVSVNFKERSGERRSAREERQQRRRWRRRRRVSVLSPPPFFPFFDVPEVFSHLKAGLERLVNW